MLHLLWYGLLAVILAGGLFAAAARFLPAGEQIAPPIRDEPPWELPADRAMNPDEIDAVRLPVALRGYRFAETDLLLDRLAGELRARDEEISLLQAGGARSELPTMQAEELPFAEAEAKRADAERAQAERLEAERLEAERLEAERLEAERLEAERAEAERAEAERAEAERLEAERAEAERAEAERLEAQRAQAATQALGPGPDAMKPALADDATGVIPPVYAPPPAFEPLVPPRVPPSPEFLRSLDALEPDALEAALLEAALLEAEPPEMEAPRPAALAAPEAAPGYVAPPEPASPPTQPIRSESTQPPTQTPPPRAGSVPLAWFDAPQPAPLAPPPWAVVALASGPPPVPPSVPPSAPPPGPPRWSPPGPPAAAPPRQAEPTASDEQQRGWRFGRRQRK